MFPPTWIARAVSDAPPSTLTVPSTRVPSSSQLASCGTRRLSTVVAPMAPRHSASSASAAAGVSAEIKPARAAVVRSLLVHMLRCAQLTAGSRTPPPPIAVELEREVRRAGAVDVHQQAHDFAGRARTNPSPVRSSRREISYAWRGDVGSRLVGLHWRRWPK